MEALNLFVSRIPFYLTHPIFALRRLVGWLMNVAGLPGFVRQYPELPRVLTNIKIRSEVDSDYTTIHIDEGLHIQFYRIAGRYAGNRLV